MIYVCGDVHGQLGLFKRMLSKIKFSDEDTLYLVGDMIDRGPSSLEVLQYIMEHKNMIPVIGNHELMMYNHFALIEKNDPWLIPNNGGQKTLEQYKKLAEEDRVKILDYIKKMLLQKEVVIGDTTFLISHSCFLGTTDGLNEPMLFGDVYWQDVSYYDALDVVWFSPWRMWEYAPLKNYESDGRIHIIGHVPVLRIEAQDWPDGVIPEMPSAYINHNIINVDVGCAMMKTYKDFRPKHLALCCVCLDKYVKGEDAFTYIEKENRKTSK